uniref:Uncharacterized protein n=1 Tax=Rhizophora mucronata TaxID=61149 RepID=A0A2P2NYY2_RHIMU
MENKLTLTMWCSCPGLMLSIGLLMQQGKKKKSRRKKIKEKHICSRESQQIYSKLTCLCGIKLQFKLFFTVK